MTKSPKRRRGWKYRLFLEHAEEALKALTSQGNAPKSADLREWVEEKHPDDIERLSKSWHVFLFKAQHDETSPIRLIPGTYTYRLAAATPTTEPLRGEGAADDSDEGDALLTPEGRQSKRLRVQRERRVYVPLRDWLASWGYAAKITAETKSGGQWGNPDISGLRLRDGLFGVTDVEVVTVEAKPSLANWKRYFFEAVSHKRFAHRSYFAALCGLDDPTAELIPLPQRQELREYGEKYAVGILLLLVSKTTFEALHSADAERIEEVPLDDLSVIELWPASYGHVPPGAVRAHLQDTLALGTDDQIREFYDEAQEELDGNGEQEG